MGKTIEVEITPDVDAILQRMVSNGEFATEEDAVRGLFMKAAGEAEVTAQERRRAALNQLHGLLYPHITPGKRISCMREWTFDSRYQRYRGRVIPRAVRSTNH
jgi:Arc/MetJ-type ribon-helix-helix transcriptional regulator